MTNLISQLRDLRTNRDSEDGFTLIELMIVVVIIGILAAIAIPIFLNQQQAAVAATIKSDVKNTVDDVALALVKTPTSTDLSGSTKTVTDGNTVTVTGAWNDYTVRGENLNASPNCYEFKSLTGKITECEATGTPGEGGAEAGAEFDSASVVFSGTRDYFPFSASTGEIVSPSLSYEIDENGMVNVTTEGSFSFIRYADSLVVPANGTYTFYMFIPGMPDHKDKALIELTIVNGHIATTTGNVSEKFLSLALEGPNDNHGPVYTQEVPGYVGDGNNTTSQSPFSSE